MMETITTVGFPAAAFIAMFKLYREERREARKERKKWMESISEHTEAVRSLRRSMNHTAVPDGGEEPSSTE